MSNNYREKIIVLWSTFLLALIFHTDLGLMPLFHGLSVSLHESPAQNMQEIAPIMWLMLIFFTLPIVGMIGTVFTESKTYRKMHFLLTIVYSVLNFFHFLADLFVPPRLWYQITLMFILFVIGLLLNLVSYQWLKRKSRDLLWGVEESH